LKAANNIPKDGQAIEEMIAHATENVQHIFFSLPEHHRILLNQLGLDIELVIGRNAVQRHPANLAQRFLSNLDSPLPNRMILDLKLFSNFTYNPDDPTNDNQRKAESSLQEEATHGVCMRLATLRPWIEATSKDFDRGRITKEQEKFRGLLMETSRIYESLILPDGIIAGRAPLTDYAKRKEIGDLQEVAYELPPEFVHIQTLLMAAKRYGS
jgi:hypothetical protein